METRNTEVAAGEKKNQRPASAPSSGWVYRALGMHAFKR